MVRPKMRTRSVKRIAKKTPKGRNVIHYKKEKIGGNKCARCKRITPVKGKKIYSGTLCSSCTEDLLRYAVQWKVKLLSDEYKDLDLSRDLTIEKFLPRGWFTEVSQGSVKKRKIKKSYKKKPVKQEDKSSPKDKPSPKKTIKNKPKKTAKKTAAKTKK